MWHQIVHFIREEGSFESVEYAVLTALLVGALIVALTALASTLTNRFGATSAVIESGIE